MNKFAPMLLSATLLTGAAHAYDSNRGLIDDRPGAGAIAFDVLFVRPLGLVSLALGTGLFVLQLPFDIGQQNGVKDPFEKLVATPARFTFTRQLGSDESR